MILGTGNTSVIPAKAGIQEPRGAGSRIKSGMTKNGFTLLEVLMVGVVLGLIVVAVWPRFSVLKGSSVTEREMNIFIEAVNQNRTMAMKENEPQTMVAPNNTVITFYSDGRTSNHSLMFGDTEVLLEETGRVAYVKK